MDILDSNAFSSSSHLQGSPGTHLRGMHQSQASSHVALLMCEGMIISYRRTVTAISAPVTLS